MTTEKALPIMAQIAPHLGAILDDDDAAEIVEAIRNEKGDLPAGATMAKLLPLFTGKHSEDLYHILAITSDSSVEAVKQQPIKDTVKDMHRMLLDETLMFFMSCLRIVRSI